MPWKLFVAIASAIHTRGVPGAKIRGIGRYDAMYRVGLESTCLGAGSAPGQRVWPATRVIALARCAGRFLWVVQGDSHNVVVIHDSKQ